MVDAAIAPATLPSKPVPPANWRVDMQNWLWRHKWSVSGGICLAALALWQAIPLFLGPTIAVDRVRRGTLIETVVATGNVQTAFRVEIGSQITGTVDQVKVDEGQRVSSGQILLVLESRELESDATQARAVLGQAEAHMRQIQELTFPMARQGLSEAKSTLLNFQQTFDRTSSLVRGGYATRVALDAAQKDLNVARSQVRSAELQVLTAGIGGSDYSTAQTQVAQARASLDMANSRLGYATVLAPRNGVLITRNVERGSVVQPGKMLFVLAPDGETQLLLAIDERNLAKLALAQTAIASADAYPDQRFAANVVYINPGVDITRASVEVKLAVPEPPAYLRQDMTVSVDIEVGRREKALVVAVRSVRDTLSATPWIMGIKDGRAYKQPVQLGLQGNADLEILEGLDLGAAAIPTTLPVTLGQRVRASAP